jgi:hypothetical protein
MDGRGSSVGAGSEIGLVGEDERREGGVSAAHPAMRRESVNGIWVSGNFICHPRKQNPWPGMALGRNHGAV